MTQPLLWLSDEPPGHCNLDPADIPRTRDLHSGVSVTATFPTDISYRMSDQFPDDLLLSDNAKVAGQIIVSAALKGYLVSALPGHRIEWLPVSIVNHKDRIESSDYFILHSLDMVDCIDIPKSKVRWNPLNKKLIMSCKGLVIDEMKIPDGIRLFRPVHWGSEMLVDPVLARAVETAGFTGLRFIPAAGYTGIG